MELPIRNSRGEVIDTAQVSDALFGVPINRAVLHQAHVMYQLNKRQGTQSTKTRAQVSGGGRKPWPQKYTGRARQGSIRSPQWRHGGIVFGPQPRDHRVDMPKKMRHLALKCVLSDKVRADKLILLDELTMDGPSTKSMVATLGNLGVTSSTLIVTGVPQEDVMRSARNLKKVWTLPVSLINAEHLLQRDSVIMTLDAVRKAEELWAVEKPRRKQRSGAGPGSGAGSDGVPDEGQVGS